MSVTMSWHKNMEGYSSAVKVYQDHHSADFPVTQLHARMELSLLGNDHRYKSWLVDQLCNTSDCPVLRQPENWRSAEPNLQGPRSD